MTHTCVQDQLVFRLQHDVTYPAIHPLSVTLHSHHSSTKAASESSSSDGGLFQVSLFLKGALYACRIGTRDILFMFYLAPLFEPLCLLPMLFQGRLSSYSISRD